MQIILSHANTDFDALASMIAAKKLYPEAQLVISDKLENRVQRFLNIYRDMFSFQSIAHVDWDKVTEMIIVDVAILTRLGKLPDDFDSSSRRIIVYDHHPESDKDVVYDEGHVEQTGAAVTLLLEKIQRKGLPISPFEASLFGLGLYTDTGNFTFSNTTTRDLQIAVYLLEQGMNLEMVQRFAEQTLKSDQQDMLDSLLSNAEIHEVDGLEIAVSTMDLDSFHNGLAMVTNKLLDVKATDAAITVVKMKRTVCVVGRANSERITLLPILQKFGGGGHPHAGSANIKKGDKEAILQEVTESLDSMLKPAVTARELMTHPVKTLAPETTIEEAGQKMYRYGHSGYPVTENGRLTGLITRRDLDKANHHGLGHAPVKAYMTTNIVTITPETTLEEIQELVIEHNIGRLPVIEDDELIGIVTRTNIIEVLHSDVLAEKKAGRRITADELAEKMQEQLPEDVCRILKDIGETASALRMPVYLIGGIVRDILLGRPNEDVDITTEGDGIILARAVQEKHGGEVLEHEAFRTATWTHPSGLSIDMTSSRLEYYEQPAALPEVEKSVLEDDLQRRDFTINAMAIKLNAEHFGELIDPFGGQQDLQRQAIKILHNISFIEDPTRIFRAVRFEERFGFAMDEQTRDLALQSIEKVKDLTAQRLIGEMELLFNEGSPQAVIRRLFELRVFQQFGLDENKPAIEAAETLEAYAQDEDVEISTFAYFLLPFLSNKKLYAAEKFALTKKRRKLLEEADAMTSTAEWQHMKHAGYLHLKLHSFSDEAVLAVLAASPSANSKAVLHYIECRRNLEKLLTGADLVKTGLKPGPHFSDLLLRLEASQLSGDVSTREEALRWAETNYCV